LADFVANKQQVNRQAKLAMAALTLSTPAEGNPVEILLVDSRQLVRAALERVLSDFGYLTVSGEAASCTLIGAGCWKRLGYIPN
jgi:hypothetical protein